MKNLRKNTDAQHLLAAHIPWYRTRKFWMLIIVIQLLVACFLFSNRAGNIKSIEDFFLLGSVSLGSSILLIFGQAIFNSISMILYHLIQLCLLYKIFIKKGTSLLYPIALTLLTSSGLVITTLFFGSMN